MKYIATIFFFIISISVYSQSEYATKEYCDSLYNTFDTVLVKPTKITLSTGNTTLDTLTIPNNSDAVFQMLVLTENDMSIKDIYIRNLGGIYSIILDKDAIPFTNNRSSGWLSNKILYQISSQLLNNRVIIVATGKSGTTMTWKLSRQIL